MSARVRTASGLAILLLAAAAARAQDTPAPLVTLDRAVVVTTIDGRRSDSAEIALPLHWDSAYPRRNGRATLTLDFPRPPGSQNATLPFAFFALRLGNAYSISLNGAPLAVYGELGRPYHWLAWKQPVHVSFPADLLADDNRLVVELRGDYARRAGLSPVTLGPADLVEAIYGRAYAYRVVVPIAAAMLSLLVAVFCLLLWLQQRDPLYAWASIQEAVWTLLTLDMVWSIAPIRWQAWALITISLRVLWAWGLYAILEQICGPHPRLERRAMKILAVSGPAALVISAAIPSAVPFQFWRGAMALLFTFVLGRMVFTRVRPRPSERLLILITVSLMLLTGIHDTLAERGISAFFADAEWSAYAGSLLAITIMWLVSKRFRAARREAAELNATLAARVEAREKELSETYARVSELERSRAVTAERERILRDMHDGVGANLATAMRQLESGSAPTGAVAATLRESLDHLKLSIDAMNLPAGDVTALLASLRYRLQPRIESSGLGLEWHVEGLPPWSAGTDQAMRHLQFLLLEAISNALQHSQAGTLTLSAHGNDELIEIVVRDNGKGIGDGRGEGLKSMRERAAAIGAILSIEDAEPGTRVRISLR